ncbi:MAG TPA: hypothetical protein VN578_01560 [Candidatus Binatia bacterium]|jgi:hypothetical protein|nr:hypothetical protein [Candidatus Binatia bacterium]
MTGKISRLPGEIRDQLNRRLANGEPADTLLPWLNGLPEVQAVINDQFAGLPVNEQNLSDYRKRGFRRWEIRQAALEFSAEAQADQSPGAQVFAEPLLNNLVHWLTLHLAAVAQSSTPTDQSEAEFRQIRHLLADVVVLRRGDLVARRIQLEQQRLVLEQTKNKESLELLFWEWTKRPDIQAKLFPHRDPDKMRRDVVRLIDTELLGVPRSYDDDSEIDPSCLI